MGLIQAHIIFHWLYYTNESGACIEIIHAFFPVFNPLLRLKFNPSFPCSFLIELSNFWRIWRKDFIPNMKNVNLEKQLLDLEVALLDINFKKLQLLIP
jgi:hypothetical protein